jgi:hypothetical protein
MVDFDIDRVFDEEDYPGLSVAATVGSASDYRRIIEEYLPLIRDQMTVRFRARMARDYPNLSETQLRANFSDDYESHDWTANGLVTGFLSGSVLLAAWSAFEQSVIAVCKYVQLRESIPLAFGDLREQDTCRRLQQYLQTATRQTFELPHSLSEVQALRNLFAHHNGNLEELSKQKRAQIEAIVRSGSGVSLFDRHQVALDPEFLRETTQKVDECAAALIKFVEDRYPRADPPASQRDLKKLR